MQGRVLNLTTAGRTQDVFTRVPPFSRKTEYTKHREASAATERSLDIIAHGGRTAKNGSWLKKRIEKM
jgi:cation transport regulator ChaC